LDDDPVVFVLGDTSGRNHGRKELTPTGAIKEGTRVVLHSPNLLKKWR